MSAASLYDNRAQTGPVSKPSELEEMLALLDTHLVSLADSTERIASRLEPVCHPQLPHEVENESEKSAKGAPLIDRLRSFDNTVGILTARLEGLRDRLVT